MAAALLVSSLFCSLDEPEALDQIDVDYPSAPTGTQTSTTTPTPTPLPPTSSSTNTPTSTPFMGGDSTHTLEGTFSEGQGGCGHASGFIDNLVVSIVGDQITIRQPSTGDVNTGTINPDGTFIAMRADGGESYEGIFNDDWSAAAVNKYTDSNGCTTTYKVAFTPLQ